MNRQLFFHFYTESWQWPIPPAPRSDWELRQYADWDLWELIGECPWDR